MHAQLAEKPRSKQFYTPFKTRISKHVSPAHSEKLPTWFLKRPADHLCIFQAGVLRGCLKKILAPHHKHAIISITEATTRISQ